MRERVITIQSLLSQIPCLSLFTFFSPAVCVPPPPSSSHVSTFLYSIQYTHFSPFPLTLHNFIIDFSLFVCNIVSSFSSHSLSHHFHRHQDCFHSDASHLRFTSLSLLPPYVSSDGVHIIIMRWKVQSWF